MSVVCTISVYVFFFFNDTATTEIYTLSLHDALPIWPRSPSASAKNSDAPLTTRCWSVKPGSDATKPVMRSIRRMRSRSPRSEEHTSELQSRQYLVCRLLLEKKKI